MNRDECKICNESSVKIRYDLRMCEELNDAMYRIIESELRHIALLKEIIINEISDQYDSDETKSAKTKVIEYLSQKYPDIEWVKQE